MATEPTVQNKARTSGANRWLRSISVGVDTTIVVVALRYIPGGLSATVDGREWPVPTPLSRHFACGAQRNFPIGPSREIESRESHAQCNRNAFDNELKRG